MKDENESNSLDSSQPAVVDARPADDSEFRGKRDFLRAVFWCVLAVVVVRTFMVEPFKIPSSSMEPTLRIGDHIFVSKFDFGWFFPFTQWELTRWSAPKRGDTIVFLFPRDPSLHYIKRVIGLPGDKVEIRGHTLTINGQVVPSERVTDGATIERVTGRKDFTGGLFKETVGEHSYYAAYSARTMEQPDVAYWHNDEVFPDTFLVMGDNRDDSYDSRSWGSVPRSQIKGKARYVWLSLDRQFQWGDWNRIRWDRAFMTIP